MPTDFCGFPVENIDGINYIHCSTYKDGRDLQELWNQDSDCRKIAFAQFPEQKMDGDNPFPGFSTGYYIHLLPRFYNTNG